MEGVARKCAYLLADAHTSVRVQGSGGMGLCSLLSIVASDQHVTVELDCYFSGEYGASFFEITCGGSFICDACSNETTSCDVSKEPCR